MLEPTSEAGPTGAPAHSGPVAVVDVWTRIVGASAPIAGEPRDDRLSGIERQRAAAYLAPAARRTFVESRWLMRRVLGGYICTAPKDVVIDIAPDGKPYLSGAAQPVRFNLSHDARWLVLAVSRNGEVGADVEALDRPLDVSLVAPMALARCEQEAVRSSATPTQTFFEFWTAKEAVAKAEGAGLSHDLRAIRFERSLEAAFGTAVEARSATGRTWWVRLVGLGTAHLLAVAFGRKDFRLRLRGMARGIVPAALAAAR